MTALILFYITYSIYIGEYNCDTPLSLIESLLNYIPQVEPDIKFGILTGDIPPHEVWSTLPFGKTQLIQDVSYQLLHDYFDSPFLVNSVLYPAIGNHEAAPTNNFPLNHSKIPFGKDYLNLMWLYESLAHNWQGWLPPHSHSLIEKNSGSYSTRPMPGLKLISLNTNFCYVMNWWLYERPASKVINPDSNMKFLILTQIFFKKKKKGSQWYSWLVSKRASRC
jgi:sphingomyelin phosphodiesterase